MTAPDDVADLLEYAKSLPDADNPMPGHLGHLIAAVEYVLKGGKIRDGVRTWSTGKEQSPSPHTFEVRVQRLRDAVASAKM